jgi:hypothetical protein
MTDASFELRLVDAALGLVGTAIRPATTVVALMLTRVRFRHFPARCFLSRARAIRAFARVFSNLLSSSDAIVALTLVCSIWHDHS